MRRRKRKEVISVLYSLHKAHRVIKNLNRAKGQLIDELLMNCQNCAIQIGNEIEQSEGEGTRTVKLLEDYCECLYLCTLPEYCHKGNAIYRELEMVISDVEKSFQAEIPVDKLKVVFLPYNASMWDSLESIWIAARDDENCEAYVVPIPYFDKNPDGSFSQMHYEGKELPEYVPVTDWQTFRMEKEKPDVIYFHNPYDEYNYVTSVHPDYYSSELKKHTDMLVYIPYFIAMGDVKEHFCDTIGVFNANKVIVQSEQVMDTYKKVFVNTIGILAKEEEEKTGIHNTQYWDKLQEMADDKFLALGSPKFDKIHSTKREDAEKYLPEEWYKKIYYTDDEGEVCRKKVVLYNTSIQALLDNKDMANDKLRYVFNTFKQKEDVVLWWRPHPLNATTIQAMVPNLVSEYNLLVEEYKGAGFGIYDDTADMHRAIAVSDAYYGDYGSVPELYKETGKPMLMQNYEIVEEVL